MSRPAITEVSPTVAPKPKAGRAAKDGAGNARRGRRAVPDRSMPDCQLPGPSTVSEQVKAEAETKGQRRTAARVVEDSKGHTVRDWPLRKAVFKALFPDLLLREV